jgi:hypothetical protein
MGAIPTKTPDHLIHPDFLNYATKEAIAKACQ